jgi:hypothetical protein
MLLVSFRPGTNVKAPGFGRPGGIVGFNADDYGQWRIVVSFPLVGGDGDLRRDFGPTELEIVPEDSNPVLEACATALLGRKGYAFDNHSGNARP